MDPARGATHPSGLIGAPLGPGDRFDGRLLIERELGRGSSGVVFAVRLDGVERPLALKVVPIRSPVELQRVRREGEIMSGLSGPHFVRLYESGLAPPWAYVLMERLQGEDLGARLDREGSLSPGVVLELTRQLAVALELAHRRRTVHRDLKPTNVFLTRAADADLVKLLDFGIARQLADPTRLTASGALIGSPAYMAPEQIDRSYAVDHRADLWSFAVIVYRALAGARPFEGVGGRLLAAIQASPAPRLSVIAPQLPPGLDPFFDRALAKDPAARFGSATELHRALEAALAAR